MKDVYQTSRWLFSREDIRSERMCVNGTDIPVITLGMINSKSLEECQDLCYKNTHSLYSYKSFLSKGKFSCVIYRPKPHWTMESIHNCSDISLWDIRRKRNFKIYIRALLYINTIKKKT